jgi:dTDP-4-amino-4,6-dideoxygalactose transaminase
MNIPISKPYFDECESKSIIKPLQSGWVVQGKFVKEFEKLFCIHTKAEFSHATTSCTTALHLALVALEVVSNILHSFTLPCFFYTFSI